jgi:hypothetical protein
VMGTIRRFSDEKEVSKLINHLTFFNRMLYYIVKERMFQMLPFFFNKNLLSSSALALSFFLASPEAKAMDEIDSTQNKINSKAWKMIPVLWDKSETRERFPKGARVLAKKDCLEVTTDCSEPHLYQLQSENLLGINPGDKLRFSYEIEGEAEGINLLLRDKKGQRPLPNALFNLQNGLNILKNFQVDVPNNAKDISILFYNESPGNSTNFIIKSLDIEKEEDLRQTGKNFPVEWDILQNGERTPHNRKITQRNGKITVETDCSQPHFYQLQSQNIKDIKPGSKVGFSFNVEAEDEGITLIVRNRTDQAPFPGAVFNLKKGFNIIKDFQVVVPNKKTDISVLFYNEYPGKNTKFTVNSLMIEKEEFFSKQASIESLPRNIKLYLMSFLDPYSLSQFSSVSKSMYTLSNFDVCWKSRDVEILNDINIINEENTKNNKGIKITNEVIENTIKTEPLITNKIDYIKKYNLYIKPYASDIKNYNLKIKGIKELKFNPDTTLSANDLKMIIEKGGFSTNTGHYIYKQPYPMYLEDNNGYYSIMFASIEESYNSAAVKYTISMPDYGLEPTSYEFSDIYSDGGYYKKVQTGTYKEAFMNLGPFEKLDK